ncbi:MAG: helix-turn-helix domain-containing protein [bacterium]
MAQRNEAREIVYRLHAGSGRPTQLPLLLSAVGRHLSIETSVAHLDDDGRVWRILNVHGPQAEVAAARTAFESYRPAHVVEKEIFGASARRLILWYKYKATGAAAASQTALAFRLLGRDTVVTDVTRAGMLTIRVLARNRGRVAEFLRLAERAAAGHGFELLYLGAPREADVAALTPSEEETVRDAWQAGYFQVPGRVDVRDVAKRGGVSPSTASYRLRRAVGKLVAAHLGP